MSYEGCQYNFVPRCFPNHVDPAHDKSLTILELEGGDSAASRAADVARDLAEVVELADKRVPACWTLAQVVEVACCTMALGALDSSPPKPFVPCPTALAIVV